MNALLLTILFACQIHHTAPDALAASDPTHQTTPESMPPDALEPTLEGDHEAPIPEAEQGTALEQLEQAMEGQPPTEEELAATQELLAEEQARQAYEEQADIGPTEEDPFQLRLLRQSEFDLPLVVNDSVRFWMRYFVEQDRGQTFMRNSLARKARYEPMIRAKLGTRGMPQDLIYLAMIESGFKTHAYSHASAVGPWQFISATGRSSGLRIDWWIDERRDPEWSTDAALGHLQELYGQFEDWYLVAAGYNAGAGGVRGAMRRTGGQDYWSIAVSGGLPRETRNYVPMMIAAMIIGHHPDRYGFEGVEPKPTLAYDSVACPRCVKVSALARCADMSESDFRTANPALRRWALPPDPARYDVHVDAGHADTFAACVQELPPSERSTFRYHKVRSGETLGAISRKYGVSVSEIARMNKIRNVNVVRVGQTLVIPIAGGGARCKAGVPQVVYRAEEGWGPELEAVAVADADVEKEEAEAPVPKPEVEPDPAADPEPEPDPDPEPEPDPAPDPKPKPEPAAKPVPEVRSYTVRRGDTLSSIARRYGVSVDQLVGWNDISNPGSIPVGLTLEIRKGSAQTALRLSYSVRRGDALGVIAELFQVSTADLMRWNGISNARAVPAGKVLAVYVPNARWTTYKVKSGDTLGKIASRHGCSLAQLKAWNGLASDRIHPGLKMWVRR